jgi:hypothetical protein
MVVGHLVLRLHARRLDSDEDEDAEGQQLERRSSSPPSSGCDAIPITQLTDVNLREPRSLH